MIILIQDCYLIKGNNILNQRQCIVYFKRYNQPDFDKHKTPGFDATLPDSTFNSRI